MQELHLDLNDPSFVRDPYPRLAELRERSPVFYDPVWKKVLFQTLLRRLPDLRIAREPVEYTGGFVIRGHKAMPVAFTPA